MAFRPGQIVVGTRYGEEGLQGLLIESTVGKLVAVVGELTRNENVGGCCYEAREWAV